MINSERKKKLLARKRKMKEQSEGGNMIFIKANETIRVRALPVDENEEFGLEIVHFFLGQDIKGVVSPQTFSQPCAIHEKYQELKSSEDDDDRELAGRVKPKRKYVVPVIKYLDLKGKKVDEKRGAKLILLPATAYQAMVDYSLDSEHGDFTSPTKGYDLKITRTGAGQFDTEYTVMNCRPTPLPKKYNKIYNVEEMLQKEMPSYEKTKSILKQYLGDDAGPIKKKKKKMVSSEGKVLKKKKKRPSSDL